MGREILSSPSSAAPVVLPDNDAKHPAHSAKLVKAAVGDHETDFLVQAFDDRVFICVSQMDKLGTMVRRLRCRFWPDCIAHVGKVLTVYAHVFFCRYRARSKRLWAVPRRTASQC